MPHAATDDFVRRYAELVYSSLRPDVSVFIEYSNEVWNPLFDGGDYALEMGTPLTDSTVYGQCGIYWTMCARARWNARRTSEIAAIWKLAWGPDADRLKYFFF